ncbi:tannase and feruloyl esterase [Aspergillus brunneoviolaceus CBS 621.78]|uniref:Tannase and feruloyl esterase n=1 Tax=Aspergillus brunneoviolaceus CBS 621.78 TaxID=1450534 RepID=A0ACD1FUH5_9EURO|nr:tannase and feruloyl esterase [Aspergillus brunneoviolaceus CBS 621.78]RAH40609.1 tannase and feruloyl esterase [Aspergillus brunneoviolaceus CBS 621.78]
MYSVVAAAFFGVATASSLSSVCTTDYVTSVLPTSSDDIPSGITIDTSSVTASIYRNYSVSDATFWEDMTINFCEVSFAYNHQNADDRIVVQYWMPDPDSFANRFLATGGAAYTINNGSGGADMAGGVAFGAATGYTDGGFPHWGGTDFDDVVILGNGTANWPAIYNWGYRAIAEMTQIGKALTNNFFDVGTNTTKLYSYFIGCSEGGREAISQAQRAPELYDGIVAGAPAMRYAQQQVNHIAAPVQIQTMGHYPPSCVFETVINATINACDGMDGKVDGVVARSDLCFQNFDISTMLGKSYSCAEGSTTSLGLGYGKKRKRQSSSVTPAQNGTISAKDIAVIQDLLTGLKDSDGNLVYFPFQPTAGFGDTTVWDSTTESWTITSPNSNGEWVTKFLHWQNVTELDMTGVTNDDLKAWIVEGMTLYMDSLQTTLPDLTPFHSKGGRLLHFHGEADSSVPPTGSIHYHESVRKVLYPELSFSEGNEQLNDWYRFYLVPGAAHCAINAEQPNAGFPRDNFAHMIQWVEEDVVPTTINATVQSGANEGEVQKICTWPSRPYWKDNNTMICEENASSVSAMLWNLTAYVMPVY